VHPRYKTREDTKGVIISRISKKCRQCNDPKKIDKKTNIGIQNIL